MPVWHAKRHTMRGRESSLRRWSLLLFFDFPTFPQSPRRISSLVGIFATRHFSVFSVSVSLGDSAGDSSPRRAIFVRWCCFIFRDKASGRALYLVHREEAKVLIDDASRPGEAPAVPNWARPERPGDTRARGDEPVLPRREIAAFARGTQPAATEAPERDIEDRAAPGLAEVHEFPLRSRLERQGRGRGAGQSGPYPGEPRELVVGHDHGEAEGPESLASAKGGSEQEELPPRPDELRLERADQ